MLPQIINEGPWREVYHVRESQGFIYKSVYCALLGSVILLKFVGERIYKSLPVRLSVRIKQFDL